MQTQEQQSQTSKLPDEVMIQAIQILLDKLPGKGRTPNARLALTRNWLEETLQEYLPLGGGLTV
jgi:hypothetical protein